MFSSEKSREAATVLAVILTAFLYRYWHLTSVGWITDEKTYLLGMQLTNSSIFHFSDSDYYFALAKNYLIGIGIGPPFPPPFTTFFLIAAFSVFGYNFFAVKIVYALLGSISLLFIYIIAKLLYGKTEALLTILICSVSFTLIFLTGALNIENVYLFTLSLTLCLFVMLYRETELSAKNPLIFSFLLGLASGAAALSRSEFLIILAALILLGALKKSWTTTLKTKIFFTTLLGFLILIAPWTYRNYVFMTQFNKKLEKPGLPTFVPFSLNGPFNFVEGHNPKANGTYTPDFLGNLQGGYRVNLLYGNKLHMEFVRNGYKIGWDYIKNNPKRELEIMPKKIKVFLNGFANGFFLNNFPVGLSGGSESMADSFVPDSKLLLLPGVLLFFCGWILLILRKDTDKAAYLPIIAISAVLLVTILFYGLSRMIYPMLPFYYMIISVSLVAIFNRVAAEKNFPKIPIIAVVALLIVIGLFQSHGKTIFEKKEAGKFGKFRISYSSTINN